LVHCKVNGDWKLIKLPKDFNLEEKDALGLKFKVGDNVFIDPFNVIRKGSLDVFIEDIKQCFQQYIFYSSQVKGTILDTYGNWYGQAEVYQLGESVSQTEPDNAGTD